MLLNSLRSFLTFLNNNSAAIVAVATTAGVIIAGLYTFYTTRLWKVAAQQARNAEVQAETAQRQLRLLEQQIAVAETTFEAVHRPHLRVEAFIDADVVDCGPAEKISVLAIRAKNYGASAATVMSVQCSVPRGERAVWVSRFLPIMVPPGDTERIGGVTLPQTPDVDSILGGDVTEEWVEKVTRWFHVDIRYRGLSDLDYSSTAQISLMVDMKNKARWIVSGITPTGPEFWEIHRGKKSD